MKGERIELLRIVLRRLKLSKSESRSGGIRYLEDGVLLNPILVLNPSGPNPTSTALISRNREAEFYSSMALNTLATSSEFLFRASRMIGVSSDSMLGYGTKLMGKVPASFQRERITQNW